MSKNSIYTKKVFEANNPKAMLIFGCPFGTRTILFSKLIRNLNKDGYTVVAYDFNNDVFYKGDATYLPKLVNLVVDDISDVVSAYKKQGITNIGFFATSLGAFVLYEAMVKVSGFKWGVLNTGGDVARGIWKFKRSKRAFTKNGYTLQKLQNEWHDLQYPEFETNLQESHFVFIGSDHDPITPLNKLREFAEYINKESGAKVEVVEVNGLGHNHTALIGLTKTRRLINRVNKLA